MSGLATPAELLDFWFLPPGDPARGRARPAWFAKDAAFDAGIVARFGPLLARARDAGLEDWGGDATADLLARIVACDQLPRNAWRGLPAAFALDPQGLRHARAMLAGDRHLALGAYERAFAYLPFEHSEDAADQALAVSLFERLAADHPATADMLDYARRHQAVIARFGRFPHRNAILGRPSTAAETAFLQEPGSRF